VVVDTWPSVAVVIPHYGDPSPTQALCRELLSDPYPGTLDVVVVDDRSPEPFGPMEGVTVIRREVNGGFGAAVNTGVRSSTSDFVLVLNSDVDVPAGFVRDLVAAGHPCQPGVFGPRVSTAGVTDSTARRFPAARHLALERVGVLARHRHRATLRRAVGLDTEAMARTASGQTWPTDWLVGIALLIPRAAYEAVGGFDERFHMYAEEVDLQRRLSDRGVGSHLVGGVSITHVGGASSDPARVEQWLMDSRMLYAAKWGWRRRLAWGWGGAAVINLVTASVRRVAGRPTRPWTDFVHEKELITHALRASGRTP